MVKTKDKAAKQPKMQVEFMSWTQFEHVLNLEIRMKVPDATMQEVTYDSEAGFWSAELTVAREDVASVIPAIEVLGKSDDIQIKQVSEPLDQILSAKRAKHFRIVITGDTAQAFFDEAFAAQFPGFVGKYIVPYDSGAILVGTAGDPNVVHAGQRLERIKSDDFNGLLCRWAEEHLPGAHGKYISAGYNPNMLDFLICPQQPPAGSEGDMPKGYSRFVVVGDYAKDLVSEICSGMQTAD
jgi:hypothetical protein